MFPSTGEKCEFQSFFTRQEQATTQVKESLGTSMYSSSSFFC